MRHPACGYRPSGICRLGLLARRSLRVAASLLAFSASATARAQTPQQGSTRTLVGGIADSLGTPIDSADVTIASLRRRVTSGTDGTFRFDKIDPGTYDVSVRRFGFGPQTRRVVVGANGGTMRFTLIAVPHALAPVISSVPRGGLSGVIGDTAFNIVEGATIKVVASDREATSDSLGKFFIDLHPGGYMVRVTRDGFVPRLVSVTIPNDSGRRMAVWLEPGSSAQAVVESWMLDALNDRLLRRRSMSKLYTREDISHMAMTELTQLTLAGGGIRQPDDCPAFIDGGPRTSPLWSISAADVESVEIYPPKSLDPIATSVTRKLPRGAYDCPVEVWVWLRK